MRVVKFLVKCPEDYTPPPQGPPQVIVLQPQVQPPLMQVPHPIKPTPVKPQLPQTVVIQIVPQPGSSTPSTTSPTTPSTTLSTTLTTTPSTTNPYTQSSMPDIYPTTPLSTTSSTTPSTNPSTTPSTTSEAYPTTPSPPTTTDLYTIDVRDEEAEKYNAILLFLEQLKNTHIQKAASRSARHTSDSTVFQTFKKQCYKVKYYRKRGCHDHHTDYELPYANPVHQPVDHDHPQQIQPVLYTVGQPGYVAPISVPHGYGH